MKYNNVLILGFGVTGQAIANYFSKKKIKNTVIDSKTIENFDSKVVSQLKKLGKTDFIFGTQEIKDLSQFDLIMTSPGVSYQNPILVNALNQKIPIKNDITLFLEEWRGLGYSIGVTGSNGKSTIVTLLHKMILATGHPAILVGNIGKSPLDYLNQKIKKNTFAVLELSSYQLESFGPEHAVDLAIISNLSSNHLDRYGGSFKKYAEAKIKIAHPNKTKLIINLDNDESKKYFAEHLGSFKNNLFFVSLKTDISDTQQKGAYSNFNGEISILTDNRINFDYFKGLKILGDHNLYNVAMALLAFDLAGLEFNSIIEKTIRNFPGLEHRIEFVRELKGVKFINDSKSTTPDSTKVAIETFAQDKKLILIMGGEDKDMNYSILKTYFENHVKSLILIPGNANQKIIDLASKIPINFYLVDNMVEAVSKSFKIANAGEIVLLSPATSSHNTYKNFEHRGRDFKKCVKSLK
jgi:UDP-N-acetylmuramoylalanine--D-glutamate ligase